MSNPTRALACGLFAVMVIVCGSFNSQAAVIDEVEPNDDTATAHDVNAHFTLDYSPDIGDDTTNTSLTIPHVTINGELTGGDASDYFAITTVTTDSIVIMDVDYGAEGGFTCMGIVVSQEGGGYGGDDYGSNDPGWGAEGSSTAMDPYWNAVFPEPATYFIRVVNCGGSGTYQLQISVQDHEVQPLPPDSDGIDGEVEDAAPNNGDGNDDGIPDSQQDHVASLPAASGGGYLTVVTSGGCDTIENVVAVNEESLTLDAGYDYPYGLIGFELPCATATIQLIVHDGNLGDLVYRKFGPPEPGQADSWFDLAGAVLEPNSVTFTLTDGGPGDSVAGDGRITDPSGPAAVVVPTLPGWSWLPLAAALAMAGLLAMMRRRTRRQPGV